MKVNVDIIQRRIENAFPGSRVEALDQGGGNHISVTVVSDAFAGKTRMQQHQMIYELFKEEMAVDQIHALAIKTSTPDQARDKT